MERLSQASNAALSTALSAPVPVPLSLPSPALSAVQQLREWWAQSGAEQAAALDGVPIAQLLNHCLLSLERADPGAQHEMDLLRVLIERWVLRFEADIAAFPEAAVPVLQRQKAQLQVTLSALSQLQQALQGLAGEAGMRMSPAAGEAKTAPAGACMRHSAPLLAWALRRRRASFRPRA